MNAVIVSSPACAGESRDAPLRWAARLLATAAVLASAAGCHRGGGSPVDDPAKRPAPTQLQREQPAMGTWFSIQVVAPDDAATSRAVDAAFAEIEAVEAAISEWRPNSDISRLNDQAGNGPVSVGDHLVRVLASGNAIAESTHGAFDMTFAACGRLWSFDERRVPSETELADCLAGVDRDAVVVDETASTVELTRARTRVGVGGIGKGYGVDRAAEVLEEAGITNYAVDGGGDVRIRGSRGDRPWRVSIADPRRREASVGLLEVTDGAVVTSGDYERYFELDGVRYHHILDPRTGMPARASIAVTVIAPDAMRADALATGLFVLGPEAGIEVAESLSDVEALIIGPDLSEHATSGFAESLHAHEQ